MQKVHIQLFLDNLLPSKLKKQFISHFNWEIFWAYLTKYIFKILTAKNSIVLKMLAGKGRNVMKYFDSLVNCFYFAQVRSDGIAIKMENLQSKNKKTNKQRKEKKDKTTDYVEWIQLSLDS